MPLGLEQVERLETAYIRACRPISTLDEIARRIRKMSRMVQIDAALLGNYAEG
jgi:hypothetical protein